MNCPFCGEDSRVLDSRPSSGEIRRRRECIACARRFTTYERRAPLEIHVAKRGSRPPEDFDHEKLLGCVLRVTRGRPVTREACENLVRGLEAELYDAGAPAISSGRLATRMLDKLRALDPVAAARFASNYTGQDGIVRTERADEPPQLALPLGMGEPEPAAARHPMRSRRR